MRRKFVWLLIAFVLLLGFPRVTALEDTSTEEETSSEDDVYSRALAKKNQEYNAQDSVLTDFLGKDLEKKNYTVMIYMIGSNLESTVGSASQDMKEMEEAGLDFTRLNLLLYTGGSTRWQTNVPCDRNCVLDMSRAEEDRIVASTEKNADMGAPESLSSFVNYCTQHYPAEHYALILWDHGGGPLWGYGSDELFGGDGLLLSEMDLAMRETAFDGAEQLDWVGFDACLMGGLENMTIWQPFADYYVASEELEPGDGWDYHFLSLLNETDDVHEITKHVVESFAAYYEAKRSDSYDPDITLSIADLSKADNLQQVIGEAAETMGKILEQGDLLPLKKMRSDAKSFGQGTGAGEGSFTYDLVDIGSLAAGMQEISEEDSQKIAKALEDLIVENYSNLEEASGVSLYYPNSNLSQFNEMRYTYSGLQLNVYYTMFLSQISAAWQKAEKHDWTLDMPVRDGDSYVMTLTEEQQENLASVHYDILMDQGNGWYTPMLWRGEAEVEEDGTVRLSADPKLIGLVERGEPSLWPVLQIENSAKRRIYQTERTRLLSSGVSYYHRLSSEAVNITMILQENKDTGELQLKTVNSVSDDAAFSGKETVNVSHYDSIFYGFKHIIPTWNQYGDLLPVAEWKDGDLTGSASCQLEEDFHFDWILASEIPQNLCYVITLEDLNGALYTIGPVPIEPDRAWTNLKETTDQGEIEYRIYEDHATVGGYMGRDTELVIPEEVDGLPVTEIEDGAFGKVILFTQNGYNLLQTVHLPDTITRIGNSAFSGCSDLQNLDLPSGLEEIGVNAFDMCFNLSKMEIPDSVKVIGAYAFSECASLTEVHLPKVLEHLGKGAFAMCPALEKIELEGNDAYMQQGGAIYSSDGKTLLAFPAAVEGEYTIAEGTEIISSDAFSRTSLSKVQLPESLKSIENYAFYGTENLEMPHLPDSLISIGKYAFADEWFSKRMFDTEEPQVVHIGPQVEYIGQEAFTGVDEKRYEVDPDNPYFSEGEGALLNKAQDFLIDFSTNLLDVYVVPDGVKDFDISILNQIRLNHVTEPCQIYLPDSLVRISGKVTVQDDLVFHCAEGSYAEEYARDWGITISYDREHIERVMTLPVDEGTLTFCLTQNHAIWISFKGTYEKLVVPETVEGLPVTVVGNGQEEVWYGTGTAKAEEIELPQTVEVIADQAFGLMAASNSTIHLPEGVRRIGNSALRGAAPLDHLPPQIEEIGEEAFHPDSFTDGVEIPTTIQRIAPGAFAGVKVPEFRMEGESDYCCVIDGMLYSADERILIAAKMPDESGTIIIPENTEIIGTKAFTGLPVTHMTIPGSVTLIAQGAFGDCIMLESVTFEEGVENIGSYSFSNTGIKELVTPKSVTRIGEHAFFEAVNLERAVIHTETIESFAFSGCTSLKEVTLEEGLLEIGEYAFQSAAFTDIAFPESLHIIGRSAFGNITYSSNQGDSSESIQLGANISSIGEDAFGALKVQDFTVDEENPLFTTVDGMLTDKAGRTLLACPSGRSGTVTVPEGIYDIAPRAFYGCQGMTDLVIPDSVTSISIHAFDYPSSEDVIKAVIHCSEGSAAHLWAMDNNWPFEIE